MKRALRSAGGLLAALALLAGACSDGSTDTSSTAATSAGSPTSTTSTSSPGSEDQGADDEYADPARWLCRPDLAENPCVEELDLTVVQEDGSLEVVPHVPADSPAFDCFYVYPTINLGDEGNAPLDGDYGAELSVTMTQAARFTLLCDMYAPVYRQITLGSFGSPEADAYREVAYGDVQDAFQHYLDRYNRGRPFVLLGHSQGSGMITRLIQDRIDQDETLRGQLISALIIGSAVSVPAAGEDVGGTFQNIPACRSATQTGCVVSYASFRSTSPPPASSFFGRPRGEEGVALCTNPAAPEGGAADLEPIYPSVDSPFAPDASGVPTIDTPYVALPGLLSGECVERDGFVYLEVTVNADPGGPRVDDISGDLTPEWGLHAVDYNVALGDLLNLVEQQATAFGSG